MQRRLDQIAAMLERAKARGEPTPPIVDVLDFMLAPLYARAMMGAPLSEELADCLVARLLRG